jgi:hypothetical protein
MPQLPVPRLRAQQHHAHRLRTQRQLRTQLPAAVVADIKAVAVVADIKLVAVVAADRTAVVAVAGMKAAEGNNL